MKKLTSLLLTVFASAICFGQIVISEINYNSPGVDSLEFIEFYNKTNAGINMTNYTMKAGVVYTFPNVTIPAHGYLVISLDSVAMQNGLGVTTYEWTSGNLVNSSEDVVLGDASGVTIDSVKYDDGSPWPSAADGSGPSLVFCDTALDNTLASSWQASTFSHAGAPSVMASPGMADSVCFTTPPPPVVPQLRAIGLVANDNVVGVPDSMGLKCILAGVVHGINMGGSSTQFVLYDGTGAVVVRKSGGFTPSYTVSEGDSMAVVGTVGQWNGLTQFNADTILATITGGMVRTPMKVAKPDASTESRLIRIDSVTIVGGTWPAPGNSTNISVETPAMDTITMRIDRNGEVDDSVTTAPIGMFSIIGYGGQFDNSSPYTSGYQIVPQVKGHIIEVPVCGIPTGAAAAQASPTSARLTWTSGSGTSTIQYGAQGFTPGTGTIVNNTVSPYILNSLTTGNSYDIYVRDTCSNGLNSGWIGPVTISLSASPTISDIWRTSSTNIMVAYTDSMDNTSATSTSRYKGIAGLTSVALNGSNDTATLTYGAPFANGVQNTLTIDSVMNATAVMLDTTYTYEFVYNNTTPSIVISEIMYNDRSGGFSGDTLEYIEIHNAGATMANIGGMEVIQGFNFIAPAGAMLPPGSYLVIARNRAAHATVFGNNLALEWTSGSLSNGGEDVIIVNSENDTIDVVDYDPNWIGDANGNGSSIVLCDVSSDNNVGSSWGTEPALFATSGYFASPGVANTCRPPFVAPLYTIAAISTVDAATGVADSNQVKCTVRGLVASNQYSATGASGPDVQFALIEADNSAGITAISFSNSVDLGYSPTLGDSVQAYGTVSQFRGLLQFNMDSVKLISQGHAMPAPEMIDTVAENNESRILRIMNVIVADTAQWPAAGSDANVDIVNMNGDTITMRIDQHTNTVATWMDAPLGRFNVMGIGGQFSSTNLDGYQILPRFDTDIDTVIVQPNCPPPAEVTNSNVTDSSADIAWNGPGTTWNIGWAKGHSSTMPTDSTMGITANPYTLTGLDTNTHYHVWVQSVCGLNVSAWVGPTMIKTLATGLEEIANAEKLVIFPNPNNTGVLRLNITTDVVIRNLLGQPVLSVTNTDEVDINELDKGVYLVEAAEGDTVKLIVE